MIFTTITLNPSLDRREYLDCFTYGGTNRPYRSTLSAGGKGINVSKALLDLISTNGELAAARVNTVTFAGGQNGEIFKTLLARELSPREAVSGITVIGSSYETRVCTKLITPANVTEINESGRLGEGEIKALIDVLADLVASGEEQTVFLSGSMPTVVADGGFAQDETLTESFPQLVGKPVENFLVTLLESCGIRVIVDTSRESLVESLKASPTLIKPNQSELEALYGKPFSSQSELVEYCRELYAENGTEVLCTLGENGSVFVGREGTFEQKTHRVFPCDPTGAGDTFLAAFAFARYAKKMHPREALSFADGYTHEFLKKSLG